MLIKVLAKGLHHLVALLACTSSAGLASSLTPKDPTVPVRLRVHRVHRAPGPHRPRRAHEERGTAPASSGRSARDLSTEVAGFGGGNDERCPVQRAKQISMVGLPPTGGVGLLLAVQFLFFELSAWRMRIRPI